MAADPQRMGVRVDFDTIHQQASNLLSTVIRSRARPTPSRQGVCVMVIQISSQKHATFKFTPPRQGVFVMVARSVGPNPESDK